MPVKAVVVLLVVAACSSADVGAPAVPEQDPTLVERGIPLYEAKCASCHGVDLRGTDQGPSHLSIVYEPGHHTDLAFAQAMRFGTPAHHWSFGDMPAVAGLSEADIQAITAYVRSQQRSQGFEPYPP